MKIGILTFHRAINYGAVLQCLALSEILKQMGHTVYIIDYRPSYVEKYRQLIPSIFIKEEKGIGKIRVLLSTIFSWPTKLKVTYKFNRFMAEHFRLIKVDSELNKKLNLAVIGSDQVWNYKMAGGFDKVYWGGDTLNNIKMISYAASTADLSFITEKKSKIKELLEHFSAVSVRESLFANALQPLCSQKISTVLDPTLLLTSDYYSKIAIKPKVENYVLLFTLEHDNSYYEFAKKISKQLNCKIIRLSSDFKVKYILEKSNKEYGVSPAEYLGFFKYAKCCINISFHATVFSLLFKRDFYILDTPKKGRVENLLQKLNMIDRLVKATKDIEFSQVNYTNFDETMNLLRKESMTFLNDNIQI